MLVPAREHRYLRFGPFTVDPISGELWKDSHKIPLQEKPFQALAVMLEEPGRLVTREELREKLWPADTFVDFEHSINTAIKKVRNALEDSGEHPRFIETLPHRGYRFIAAVEISGDHPSPAGSVSPGPNDAVTESPSQIESRHPSAKATVIDIQRPREGLLGPSDAADHRGESVWRAVPFQWRIVRVGLPVLVVLAVVAAIAWYRLVREGTGAAKTAASIAVLPFADLSPGHDHEYFSEGLAEEILNRLTKIPKLRVTARGSAFQFKERNEDSRVIGQKLDVADILEGSVQRAQSRVRVTARLIRADDGFDLWSDSFDRDFKDIFAVEDDIAKDVTSALQVKLLADRSPAALTTSGTTNPEAYEAFLHARYFEHMQDEASAKKALQYVDRAIQSDPNYAPAYALRANIELFSGAMVWTDLSEAADKARRDTEKAIAVDPNLADGYRVLSQIQSWFELNCPEAGTSLKRAIDLAPGDPDNLDRGGLLAMCQGDLERATDLWKQELLLDPLRPDGYLYLAQSLRDLGRYEEAHGALAKALDLNPNQIVMIHEVDGEVYLAQGRPQDALAEMEKEPTGYLHDLGAALAYHALGQHQKSDEALASLISQHSNDAAYQIAQVYAYRGEVDQAFKWLDRAYAQHDSGLMWFKTDLKLKSLRKDPRCAKLLKKLNLPE